jgi:threonine dehydratase
MSSGAKIGRDDESVAALDSVDSVAWVTRDRIAITERLIRARIRRTPVIRLDRADLGLAPGPLVLKLEQTQHTGSFKVRGAFANLLTREVPAAGAVAASGGNHGVAVAYVCQALGVPARIFVPTVSSPAKIARIRSYAAELVVTGETYGDALAASQDWAAQSGALVVHAFDQVETMLGAGTLAVELEQQAPDVDTLLVAVGGGGLIAGIAASYAGSVRVIGVEPEAAPTLTHALAAGGPVIAPTGSIAVDSLAPRQIGENTFPVIAAYTDGTLLVSDDDLRNAQHLLWDRLRLVAEPGGCAALAALLSGRLTPADDEVVAVVISGANTNAVSFT